MVRPFTKALVTLAAATALVAGAALPASAASGSSSGADVRRGYTKVVVAPSTLAALVSLGVTPGVVAPGTIAKTSPLDLHFPITGYADHRTKIFHSGGVTLSAGSTTVTITDFTIDLVALRVSGDVAGIGRVDLFKIRASHSRYGAVRLVLTETAASALNAAFGITALTKNMLFGYATVRPYSRY
jgi:hypothetical protein